MSADKVIVSGYLVRCPLGGYAWQILHYLLGLQQLGFIPYFYEDNRHFWDCYDPTTRVMTDDPAAGVRLAGEFFRRHGFATQWSFHDALRERTFGLSATARAEVLDEARIVINLAGVNRVPPGGPRQRRAYIDLDPAFTQIKAAAGDRALRELLDDCQVHFTFGENIGRARCRVPLGGVTWHPTRQPVVLDLWTPQPPEAAAAFTTVGKWDDQGRDLEFEGETYAWRKRVEWMKFLDLPGRSGERFDVAMNVESIPDDFERMRRHGWGVRDPLAVSADPERYREFICRSKAEFTVAKDLNVRLATGWFSDRSACYLAAGRPVITQDTGFDDIFPTGAGLFSYRTLDEAVDAVQAIAGDYARQSAAARSLAAQYFSADVVLGKLLSAL
ncbi:MAG TPA: glycosyltransferase [Candidatus Kryptonia bacterium]|nr:glycosyltransferase [Candidatus Kryptonia bacterium]